MHPSGTKFTDNFRYFLLALVVTISVPWAWAASTAAREEGEIRVDAKSQLKPKMKHAAKPVAKPALKASPAAAVKTETKAAAQSAATAKLKADQAVVSNSQSKGDLVPVSSPVSNPEARADATPAPKAALPADSAADSKVKVKPEVKAEQKAETRAEPRPDSYSVACEIRPLKGKLDHTPVLNSNSPEIVPGEGILLSTLDPLETKHPEAHLNYAVKGHFAIFFHHINKQEDKSDRRLLTISLLAFNPGSSKATLTFNSLASYVSQPDAPVCVLPPVVGDDHSNIYAGQGDRVASDYVRGAAALDAPFSINVAPRSYCLVTELPIKVYGPVSTLNGRTYYANAQASKPLQFALLAAFSPPPGSRDARAEESNELWHPEEARANMINLQAGGTTDGESANFDKLAALVKMADDWGLAGPREGDKRAPTVPHSKEAIVYGRVSGVQIGSKYTVSHSLPLEPGRALAIAYPVSSLEQGTMGTGEVQTAPLIKRYATSAYAAHGNYCVRYQVDLKLVNRCKKSRFVDLALSTPLKSDKVEKYLYYFKDQDRHVFFRGVVKVIETDSHGKLGKGTVHYYHLVAHRGEKLPPFSRFELEAGSKKTVRIELYYTPDATPPQVLTVDSAI